MQKCLSSAGGNIIIPIHKQDVTSVLTRVAAGFILQSGDQQCFETTSLT